MSVTPPISSFFGLDPSFLSGPAASSSLINPLLYGSSFQMVPINFGGFYSGVPPIFGGSGFSGFPNTAFNIYSQPSYVASPFTGGGAFGNGFGTTPFGNNPMTNGLFSNQMVNPYSQYGYTPTNTFVNPLASMMGGFNTGATQNPFAFGAFI